MPQEKFSNTRASWLALMNFAFAFFACLILLGRPKILELVRSQSISANWLLVGPIILLILFVVLLAFKFSKNVRHYSLFDFAPVMLGVVLFTVLFPQSLREFQTRKSNHHSLEKFATQFLEHKDARIRALSILAMSHKLTRDSQFNSLIKQGLLDKDPLVQHVAKLVIEDYLGIRLKSGAEGLLQAKELIISAKNNELSLRKGLP